MIVAGVVVVWDLATNVWFFDALFRLDVQAARNPGFGSSVLRAVLGPFFGIPVWLIWAALIGANVAALSWSRVGRYRAAAVFGIGFGPGLSIVLEGHSPVSGGPPSLLVPLWLLIIGVDTCATWGIAWCIVALANRAKMARRETNELRQLGGFPAIGRVAGFAAVFAGGNTFGSDTLIDLRAMFERQAEWNAAKAQENFRREVWRHVPGLVRASIAAELLRHNWSRSWVRPVER
jgi:hypothetical protein